MSKAGNLGLILQQSQEGKELVGSRIDLLTTIIVVVLILVVLVIGLSWYRRKRSKSK